ncbi:hypothetical protein [Crocinitomix catalasitica]|uniref:hypothetical protein n=1 Tax=Crocinitomix catalasitica TaxID=184607 RepID=UPI00048567D5|nr:hypothetical protein [Crocinitomix catalasitica]
MTTKDSTRKSFSVIKFLLLIFLTFPVITAVSQTIGDTIYYTKQWNITTDIETHYYSSITTCNDMNRCERSYFFKDQNIYSNLSLVENKKEGISKWFYKNGNLKVSASYKNDVLHGELTRYFENGEIKLNESYDDGVLKATYLMNADNNRVYFKSDQPALVLGCKNVKASAKKLQKSIKNNKSLIYDENLNEIHGEVIVEFIVNLQGGIEYRHFIDAENIFIEKEAERILKALPKFQPAMHNGTAVLSFGSIKITI